MGADALGRSLPVFGETGPPRPDRTVGIFYFLWLGPHADKGGPWDVTRILAQDPDAMRKPDSPLWGPLHAPHHWGESIFGYYNTDDPYVLRKHAQLLSDAGVDVVIFDVTNQLTYRSNYLALLRVWSEVRREGSRTPQIAFLCPFWEPAKVVNELYRDLYEPGIHPELWFRWQGRPLILADPAQLGGVETIARRDDPVLLPPGRTLGQSFAASKPFAAVGGSFPTWRGTNSAMTLTLRSSGPTGERITSQRFERVSDNTWLLLRLPSAQPAGAYYLEMSEPAGQIGWWSSTNDVFPRGQAFADGVPAVGDRNLRIGDADERTERIRRFFTFRKPQPDYFRGQTAPDSWSWLEVFPQHAFTNSFGEKEQISVGAAQNAVGRRLGSMSEPGARGRSFHGGEPDPRPGAVNWGGNFAEQFGRALQEDPRFIFITGWNEWIAGRFAEFNGIKLPVMFVDEFDQEHSRDTEPMKGGHGDNYYYQMAAFIRRYKGVRAPRPTSAPRTIRVDGGFEQWNEVAPEFRDDLGDTTHRDFAGYANHTRYANDSGRNDLAVAKVTCDERNVYFYIRTRQPITPGTGTNWMWLLIDVDRDHRTGWEGYDFIVNHSAHDTRQTRVERNAGGWKWAAAGEIPMRAAGNELHLAIPRTLLGFEADQPIRLDFKWADDVPDNGDIVSWLDAGDTAPNGRFNYRFEQSAGMHVER
ncbi:MAG: hypothetical protein ACYDH9_05170 [Limisphaerales bacterium]